MHVSVTIQVHGREVPVEKVADPGVVNALKDLGRRVEDKLQDVSCDAHNKAPANVRVHVDGSGNADIRYDSCCDDLKSRVAKALA